MADLILNKPGASRTGLLFSFLSVLLLSSCLHVDTDIKLKKDGSAEASISYTFSPDSVDFGRGFGADEPWPFPLTEKDFTQQSLRISGVKLKSYRVHTESDGSERIDVKLKAESLSCLSEYLGMDLTVTERDGDGTMVFTLPSTYSISAADPQSLEEIENIIGDSSFRLSFKPPSSPEVSEPGRIERNTAVLELTLSDILQGKSPDSWVVSW